MTALCSRENLPQDLLSDLNTTIRHAISLRGFRNPSKAPIELLLPSITDAFQSSEALVRAVLNAWLETHLELCESIGKYLDQQGEERIHHLRLPTRASAVWQMTDMRNTCAAYLCEHPKDDHEQACLALCCLLGRIPMQENDLDVTDKLGSR